MLITKTMLLMSIMIMSFNSLMMMIPSILLMVLSLLILKWIQTSNPWMPLIIALAFLGGMMIIFMYIVSLMKKSGKKNKNKINLVFVFAMLSFWTMSMPHSSNITLSVISCFNNIYFVLCILITLILMISTKLISSPFKALKGSA